MDARREAGEEQEPSEAHSGSLRDEVEDAPESGETISDYFAFEEIFTRVLATADHELDASTKYLFWSGLAAGFALGLTFLARVIFTEAAGEASPGLIGNLLYPVGFLMIVIGRYQLFTENTLTPVVLVLTKLASLANLLRLWSVVFAANMIGAAAAAALIAYADVLDPAAEALAVKMSRHGQEATWLALFSKALIAGWIVASMVWLVHAAMETLAKILIVWFLMYFVGVGAFFHVVTSSVEAFFLFFHGETGFWGLWPHFVLPICLGNTLGGILFVAVINTVLFGEQNQGKMLDRYGERFPWREWVFGRSKLFGDARARVK